MNKSAKTRVLAFLLVFTMIGEFSLQTDNLARDVVGK